MDSLLILMPAAVVGYRCGVDVGLAFLFLWLRAEKVVALCAVALVKAGARE